MILNISFEAFVYHEAAEEEMYLPRTITI